MEKVIAIFDIGKTNKKLLLFNERLELVYQHEEKLPPIVDDDNFECDDAARIVAWIRQTIETLIIQQKYDLTAVNFSTYGATLAFVGEDGELVTPLYNYLKPMPGGITKSVYEKHGGVEEFSRCTASPALGMLNSGLQILWLKRCKPHLFGKVRHIMHFPQYLSYCFTKRVTSEYTSIGCHTALWNFDTKSYHPWLEKEGIQLPYPISNNTAFDVSIAGKIIKVGIGIHDSSSSLVPYLMGSKDKFILASTGTWSIFMNPFNEEPLTKTQLEKDTLCYLSTLQNQVKSSRMFMGHIHDVNTRRIAEFFKVSEDFYKEIKPNSAILKRLILQCPPQNQFFRNGIPAGYIDETIDLSNFPSVVEAYHQLILDITYKAIDSLKLIIPEEDTTSAIYISGGFARNELFVQLLATLIPQKRFFTSEIDNATALGAALSMSPSINNKHIDLNLGLKAYKPLDILH